MEINLSTGPRRQTETANRPGMPLLLFIHDKSHKTCIITTNKSRIKGLIINFPKINHRPQVTWLIDIRSL